MGDKKVAGWLAGSNGVCFLITCFTGTFKRTLVYSDTFRLGEICYKNKPTGNHFLCIHCQRIKFLLKAKFPETFFGLRGVFRLTRPLSARALENFPINRARNSSDGYLNNFNVQIPANGRHDHVRHVYFTRKSRLC